MKDKAANISYDVVELAADIVVAYVANNSVPASELASLIAGVHTALVGLANGSALAAAPPKEIGKPTAVQIRKSITPDGLISFLDGKSYKTLKRHLATFGLDQRSYCERFGLPSDYPMVASNYAAKRSALAKQFGLGRPSAISERQQGEVEEAGGRRKVA